MAIAFDAGSASSGNVVTDVTWPHTTTGANRIMFVGVSFLGGGAVTGVTYNGVTLTFIDREAVGGIGSELWYLIAPATGAHDVVVSLDGSRALTTRAATYTGALQSGVPDATNKGAAVVQTSYATSVTTIADNCWVILNSLALYGGTATAGASTTRREDTVSTLGDVHGAIFDSNGPVTPAGSRTLTTTTAPSTSDRANVVASFAPASGGGESVSWLPQAGILRGRSFVAIPSGLIVPETPS